MATRQQRKASKSSKSKKSDLDKLEEFLKGLSGGPLADEIRGFVAERKQGAGGLQGDMSVGTEAPASQFDNKWSLRGGPEGIRSREDVRASTNEAFRRGLGKQAREESGIAAPQAKSRLDRLKGLAGRAGSWLASGRGGIEGRNVQRRQPAPEVAKPSVGLMQPTSPLTQPLTASPTAPAAAGVRRGGEVAQGGPSVDPRQGRDFQRPPVATGGAVTAAQRKKLMESAGFSGAMPPAGQPPIQQGPRSGPQRGSAGQEGSRPTQSAPQRPPQAAPQPPLTLDQARLPAALGGVGRSRAMGFGDFQKSGGVAGGGYSPAAARLQGTMEAGAQRAGAIGARGKDEKMYAAGDQYGGGQARFNVEEKQVRDQIDTLLQKAQGGDRASKQELSKIHADLTSQADRAEGGPRVRPGQGQLETTVGGSGAQKLPQVIVNRILKDYSQQVRNVRAERTQGRRAAK